MVNGRYELRVGTDTVTVDGTSGAVRLRHGTADEPEATATTDASTLHAVALGQRPMSDAVASGDLRLDGAPEAVSRLTGLLLTLAAGALPERGRECIPGFATVMNTPIKCVRTEYLPPRR